MTDRQNEALLRLLVDATQGGQAKVDALVALSQRSVWVAPWPGTENLRTLASSGGLVALPVFTSEATLGEAAVRFGWLDPTGQVAKLELGARAAFRHAIEKNLAFVVVDITEPHALELARDEIEPLLAQRRRDSQGPFAATGRIESSLMAAVARRSSPGSAPTHPAASGVPTPAPGAPISSSGQITAPSSLPVGALPEAPASAPLEAHALSSAPLGRPSAPPEDALVDRLDALLRGYPEVEWACLGLTEGRPALGLRVDARLRSRLDALASVVAASGLVTVVLDDPLHFKASRTEAFVFYPWRR